MGVAVRVRSGWAWALGAIAAVVVLGVVLFTVIWRATAAEADLVERWLAHAAAGEHRAAAALLAPGLKIDEAGMIPLAASMGLSPGARVTWHKRTLQPGRVEMEGRYEADGEPGRGLSATVVTVEGRPVITAVQIDPPPASSGVPDQRVLTAMAAQTLSQVMQGLISADPRHLTDFREDAAKGYLAPAKVLEAFAAFRPPAEALLGALTAGALSVSEQARDGRILVITGVVSLDGQWPWKITYAQDGGVWIAVGIRMAGPGKQPFLLKS